MSEPGIPELGRQLPEGLQPPLAIEEATASIPLWEGVSALHQGAESCTGKAAVLIDMLPRPVSRFTFEADGHADKPGETTMIRRWFSRGAFQRGELRCDAPIGSVAVDLTSVGAMVSGRIVGWSSIPSETFTSAKLLVINGPSVHGEPINRGTNSFLGRLENGGDDGTSVIVDQLSSKKPDPRTPFAVTGIAEIRFDKPRQFDEFVSLQDILFRTLSMMRGRWVGLVGPWLYADDVLKLVSPRVTKVTTNGSGPNWCHDTLRGTFRELSSAPGLCEVVPTDRRSQLADGRGFVIEITPTELVYPDRSRLRYKLDCSALPARMKTTLSVPRSFDYQAFADILAGGKLPRKPIGRAIYEVKDDQLKHCISAGREWPKSFEVTSLKPDGVGVILFVLRRIEPTRNSDEAPHDSNKKSRPAEK